MASTVNKSVSNRSAKCEPTGSERLKTSLEHKEPDRIPFDIGSTKMTGISLIAFQRYLDFKGWILSEEKDLLQDPIQQLARVPEEILQRMKVDVRGIFPAPSLVAPNKERYAADEDSRYLRLVDEWGIGWQMPVSRGHYYDLFRSPLENDPDEDIQVAYQWPNGADPGRFDSMAERIDQIRAGGHGIVMHGFTSGMFEMYQRLRGYENALIDLMTDEKSACRLLDSIVDAKIRYWDVALRLSDGWVQAAVEVDDLGTQNSLLISRDLYRKILFPRHKKLFRFIHETSPGTKVFMHSCGAVRDVIPDLIDAGVDILNPVQTSATGMDPICLKRDFGRDLVFWGGGVDTQRVLPHGTPLEVRDNVKRNIEAFAPGGGFVFTSVHNIQADVPPENLEAMIEALALYGIYR